MRSRILLSIILFICSFSLTTTVFAFPSFTWIVADSAQPSPKNVGFVVSISTEFDVGSLANPSIPDLPRHVLVFVPIPKVPGPDSWRIGLTLHPDEIPLRGALFFTSADCSGAPWIGEFQGDGEFDPAFDPHVVIGDILDPAVRTLYVADPGTPLSAPMDFNSIIFFGSLGACGPAVRNMQAKPAILVDADLHQTYPPSYSLFLEFAP
jgi:hypothetical protein